MIAMSKEKMIQYLKDYANIQNYLMHNPNIPIGKAFDNYMITNGRYEDDTREYYDRMRRVYIAYNAFKKFSIIEDFLLNRDDFLSNNDLNGIESNCNFIIAPAGLTNKRIVQLIRNAFNHNDSLNIDRFKISENGKYFEIAFIDIRTVKEIENGVPEKPVKIKFNLEYLLKVHSIINSKRQNQLFLSFDIPKSFNIFSDNLDAELDKIKFIHYYFNRKLPRETIDKFDELSDTSELSNEELLVRSYELHVLAKSINKPAEFHLDKYQKNKLKDLIIRYKKNYRKLLDDNINGIMYYFLSKVIPVAAMKQRDIEQQVILCIAYFEDVNLSINEVLTRIARILNNEENPSSYDDIDKEVHDLLSEKGYSYSRDFYKNLLDGEFVQILPIITYIDSVIMHYCTDNHIEIAGRVYNKEKIRNSFAHGRWYITHDLKIILYDADPRNINDYNLEFVGRIDIVAFQKWAEEYMEKSKRQIKKF